jgi:multicomponent K+:H+ antiporter subunit C
MEALYAAGIAVLTACGIYLMLRARTYPVVLGLTLLSYATNLFLFSSGGLMTGHPAVIREGVTEYADPLPQALVLTAIVIGFGMVSFLVILALRARGDMNTDHVDGSAHDRGHDK